jgi:hypothetical protein
MTDLQLPVGYGQIAYEAYWMSCHGISLRGEALPPWSEQHPDLQAHWNSAAQAVADYLDRIPNGNRI